MCKCSYCEKEVDVEWDTGFIWTSNDGDLVCSQRCYRKVTGDVVGGIQNMKPKNDIKVQLNPLKDISPRNIGVDWTRAVKKKTYSEQVNLEKIFMEEWDYENRDKPGINNGLGTAQLLMIISEKSADLFDGPHQDRGTLFDFSHGKEICVYNLTGREQRIIATIIQWLGTNVGFGFICRCLRRANYNVVDIIPNPPPSPPSPPPTKTGRFRILEMT